MRPACHCQSAQWTHAHISHDSVTGLQVKSFTTCPFIMHQHLHVDRTTSRCCASKCMAERVCNQRPATTRAMQARFGPRHDVQCAQFTNLFCDWASWSARELIKQGGQQSTQVGVVRRERATQARAYRRPYSTISNTSRASGPTMHEPPHAALTGPIVLVNRMVQQCLSFVEPALPPAPSGSR